jgi:hypothetical protein
MGRLKKPMILIPALFLVASLAIIGVLAFYTDNEFHLNTADIEPVVVETIDTFPEEWRPDPDAFVPGNTVTYHKEVAAKNVGKADCYVRMAIEFSDSRTKETSYLSNDGNVWWSVEEYKYHLPRGWVYVEDTTLGGGYYYYKEIVHCEVKGGNGETMKEAETTPTLFKYVRTEFTPDDFANYFDIHVYSEAIQTISNTGERYTNGDIALNTWRSFLLNRP